MRDGSTPKKVQAGRVLVTSVVRGDGIGSVGSPSKAGARKALRDCRWLVRRGHVAPGTDHASQERQGSGYYRA